MISRMNNASLNNTQCGAIHLIGILSILVVGAAIWFLIQWQDRLTTMQNSYGALLRKVEFLEVRVHTLEMKP